MVNLGCMATSKVRFVTRFNSTQLGHIEPGDEHTIDADDATRYIKAGWAVPVAAAKPKGRAAGRNGKEG